MKKLMGISLPVPFVFLFVANVSAQQWTDEQKVVWAGVDAYWEVGLSDNPDDFLNYFDDSYYGWSNENGARALRLMFKNLIPTGTKKAR